MAIVKVDTVGQNTAVVTAFKTTIKSFCKSEETVKPILPAFRDTTIETTFRKTAASTTNRKALVSAVYQGTTAGIVGCDTLATAAE